MNYLQENFDSLGETAAHEYDLILVRRFNSRIARATWHEHYYQLGDVADRDQIESLLDDGLNSLMDTMSLADLLTKLDTMNDHLAELVNQAQQLTAAMYTADDVAIADVLDDLAVESGGAWDDSEIGELIDKIGLIATLLG